MSSAKVKAQGCNTNPTLEETCGSSVLLSSPQTAGWTYTWYDCNATGGNTNLLSSTPSGTYTAYPSSSTGNQTYYYIYIGDDGSSNLCTSGVITVKYDYDLEIADISGTYTVQTYSGASTYSGYQWYLNGTAIPGATNSTCTPVTSGTYTVTASSSCGGTRTSNGITYTAPNTQCSSSMGPYSTCNSTFTLSYTPAAGYSVDWYECDQYGGNGSFISAGNSYTVGPTSTIGAVGQYLYFYYICTDNFTYATCTSTVVTVRFDLDLNIYSISGTSLPSTLSAYGSGQTYTNFQWYRNGQAIIGAASNSYYSTLPGEYYMTCTSPCGLSTSNTISLCGPTPNYSNYTFTGNQTLSNITIVFDGTIIIDSNASLTISNCDVIMTAGSEIIVKRGDIGYTDGGNLQISYSKISSCGKWGGIYAEGYFTYPRSPAGAAVVLSHSEIRDAYIGLFADNNAKLSIDYTLFENNYQHLDLRGFGGYTTTCHGGGGYEGGNWEFSHNTFNYLMENIPAFTPTNLPSTPNNSSYRKQVYIDGVRTIKLSNCTFNCYNWSAKDQNALEVNTAFYQLCYTPAFEVNGCTFNGDYNDAMRFTDAYDVRILSNNISGDVNHGIEILTGGYLTVFASVDVGVDIEDNTIYNTSSTHGGVSGVNISQVEHLTFLGNDVQHFVKGLEYYNLFPNACTTNDCVTTINSNKFKYNQYGIVLAPEEDPIGTTAHNQSTNITVNQMSNITIFCNILYYNDYGIVGYGEINDLPFSGSGMASWANKFAPLAAVQPNSTSTYADIVYLWSGVAIAKPNIKHFVGPDPTSGATSGYFTSDLKIFTSTNNYSLDLEGVTIDHSNIGNQLGFPNASHDGCWTTASKTDPMGFGINIEKEVGLSISPNPFSAQLTIGNPYDELINFTIYNTLGEIVKQGVLKATTSEILSTEGLAAGCYYLKTYSSTNGFLIYTRKLIKTN